MQMKKTGLLTKAIILALLIYMATSLLNLRAQLQTYQAEQDALSAEVAQVTQQNAALADAVEHSDDPATLEAVARDKGFVKAGERLFVDVAN